MDTMLMERLDILPYDDSEWTDDELLLLLAHSAQANGWDEPGMDAYDRYDTASGFEPQRSEM